VQQAWLASAYSGWVRDKGAKRRPPRSPTLEEIEVKERNHEYFCSAEKVT